MNNLVFNTTAGQLLTTISNTTVTVGGTVAVSSVTGTVPVTIQNTSLTVAGSVTISNVSVTVPVTIQNTSLTVAGSVTISNVSVTVPVTIQNTSLTVAGSVTISNVSVTVPVTIQNTSITTSIQGYSFSALTVSSTSVTGNGTLFADTDISQIKVASVLLFNEGANTLTFSIMLGPDTSHYLSDPDYTDKEVPGTSSMFVDISKFAHYVELVYTLGSTTATFSAYYNAQT